MMISECVIGSSIVDELCLRKSSFPKTNSMSRIKEEIVGPISVGD